MAGASWEGFVIETLIAAAPGGTQSNFYRTAAGAEIDLLLTPPGSRPWAIEIKRSLTPKVEKGFYLACEDIDPARRIVVYPGTDGYPLKENVEAMSLKSTAKALLDLASGKSQEAACALPLPGPLTAVQQTQHTG